MNSAVDKQRKQLEELAKNPERALKELQHARATAKRQNDEVETVPDKVYVPPPPTFVDFMRNRPSTASAEFHEYKKIMRKEMDRKERLASEEKAEKEAEEFEQRNNTWRNRDQDKTQKNRERRKKRKLAKNHNHQSSSVPQDIQQAMPEKNIESTQVTQAGNECDPVRKERPLLSLAKSDLDVNNNGQSSDHELADPVSQTHSTSSVKIVDDDYF